MVSLFSLGKKLLSRRQIRKIENLIGGNLFGDAFGLARVADGVGD